MTPKGTTRTRTYKVPLSVRSLALALLIASTLTAPAWASVASEQQQGAQTIGAVHAGSLKGSSLSSSQYEQVGEYLMGQALKSTQAHDRMNSLASQMMGSTAVDQMHIYLGKRYLGVSAQIPGRFAPMYGLVGMMTGYRGSPIAGMMSGYLGSQNRSASPYGNGSSMMGLSAAGAQGSTSSWPAGAIVATAVLAALLLGALALTVARLRRGGHPPRGRPADAPVR